MEELIKVASAGKAHDFLILATEKLKDGSLWGYINSQSKDDRKEMHRIIRYSLTGQEITPPNDILVEALGVDESVKRLLNAANLLESKFYTCK